MDAVSFILNEEFLSQTQQERKAKAKGDEPLEEESIGIIYTKLDKDNRGGIDPFMLYTALISTHTLVPLDILKNIFTEADKDCDGSLSIDELTAFLHSHERLQAESSWCINYARWIYIMKVFWSDNSIPFAIAGIFLFLATGGNFFSPLSEVQSNIYFLSSIFYFIGAFRGLVSYTKSKWLKIVGYEKMCNDFIESILRTAKELYYEENEELNDDEKTILRAYVDGVLYQDNMIETLSRSDLELLMFKEIGFSIDTSVLQYIWGKQKFNKSSAFVEADEMYEFLTTRPTKFTKVKRALSVLTSCVKSFVWLMCLSYFIAASVSLITKIIPRLPGGSPVNMGFTTPSRVISYFYLIGSIHFVAVAAEGISSSYYHRIEARPMIKKWLDELDKKREQEEQNNTSRRFSDISTNSCRTKLIRRFMYNGGFEKMDFSRLLEEECGLNLPKNEVDEMFDNIDKNGNGKISEADLRDFIGNITHRSDTCALIFLFVTSNYFWAQFTWFVGSVNFYLSSLGIWSLGNDTVSENKYLSTSFI